MTLPTPSIEYFLLCPMLIVFGVAVAGVLVEAFLPRRLRYGAQVTLALGRSGRGIRRGHRGGRSVPASGRSAVLGAVAIDRPTLFLQGTVLLVAVLAVIFMAERTQAKGTAKPRWPWGRRPARAAWIPLRRRRPRFPAATPNARRSGRGPPRRSSSRWRCCPSAA